MKRLLLTLFLAVLAFPAMAADPAPQAESWLKPVEHKYVCMMNNAVFDKEQMAIEVEGKTYYGCCEMCKGKLQSDASARQAVDPVSGKTVDKADAVIGEYQGVVYYFENQANFEKFAGGPKPVAEDHAPGMNHDMMDGMDMSGQKGAAPATKHEDHQH